jgi:hypothetical protein
MALKTMSIRPSPETNDPAGFAAFSEPGWAKAALSFQLTPTADGTVLAAETRVMATDEASRRRFGRYWRLIRMGGAGSSGWSCCGRSLGGRRRPAPPPTELPRFVASIACFGCSAINAALRVAGWSPAVRAPNPRSSSISGQRPTAFEGGAHRVVLLCHEAIVPIHDCCGQQ